MMLNKILLVTDSPVDNYQELARQTLARIDFHTDLVFSKGPLDVLDHSSPCFAFGSKLGIDATKKLSEEKPSNTIMENNLELLAILPSYPSCKEVTAWNFNLLDEHIPIAILAVHEPNAGLIATLGSQLLADKKLSSVKIFILLDDTIDIFDLSTVCWLVCANVDPERDIRLAEAPRQQMVIDACMKYPQSYDFPREWPNVVTSSETTIFAVNQKWKHLGLGSFVPSPSLKFLNLKKEAEKK